MALSAEERQRRLDRLLALKATGLTDAAIAEQEARELGIKPRAAAAVRRDIDRSLADKQIHVAEAVKDSLVVLELERLDSLQRNAEATLRAANAGRCTHCGRSPDPELALKAVSLLNRLGVSRRALLGLDNRRREVAQGDDPLQTIRRRAGLSELRAVK